MEGAPMPRRLRCDGEVTRFCQRFQGGSSLQAVLCGQGLHSLRKDQISVGPQHDHHGGQRCAGSPVKLCMQQLNMARRGPYIGRHDQDRNLAQSLPSQDQPYLQINQPYLNQS